MSDFKRAFLSRVKAQGGWIVILDRIASGEPIRSIAPDYDVSKSYLHRMVSRKSQPALREAYLRAKKESAESHAQKALELVDNVPVDRDAIAKVRLQVEHRRFLAQSYDRETFGGPNQAPSVTLNFGALHLDALRRAAPARVLPSGPAPAALPVLPAELEPAHE